MKLVNTRCAKERVSFSEALLSPSAKFGGLYAPKKLPKFGKGFFKTAQNLSYTELAIAIIESFKFDVETEIFRRALKRYERFDDPKCPVNIQKIGKNLYINELYHGPTRAFKDMALQPFGVILDELAQIRDEKYLVMCATSGDTGPATLQTFANAKNVKVVCLYPASGTSEVQRLQMVNANAQNLKTIGIKGNFDDAQTALKSLLADENFKSELAKNNLKLSAANSVNFGRILFQIIYYFYEYLYLLKNGVLKADESFDIVVPSGNFGNALGAYYARKMGVKIKSIKIASNANNVLTDFFEYGYYTVQDRKLIKTISPAMDILISSNVERLLYSKLGDKETKWLMKNLKKQGFYEVNARKFAEFKAKFCTDKECTKFIKEMAKKGILIDPHTATCFKFKPKKRINVITSTAHWVKFTPSMIGAIKGEKITDEKAQMMALAKEFKQEVPSDILSLFDGNEIHKDIVEKSEIKAQILNWIKR